MKGSVKLNVIIPKLIRALKDFIKVITTLQPLLVALLTELAKETKWFKRIFIIVNLLLAYTTIKN